MGGRIPEMKVLLAGGVSKPAGELKVGDRVDTLHQHSLNRQEAEITYVRVIESPLLDLTLSGKTFSCSEEDAFYSSNNKKWIKATDLVIGDKISKFEGELEFQGSEKLGKGKSVELTVDGPHTYVCDGVLLHNKGGGGSPPPPTIIMPPPPPPPQIVTDVTPQESYRDAAGYLKRLDDRERAIEERRWDAGQTPGNVRSSHAAINLRDSELANNLDQSSSFPGTPGFGSQTQPGGMAGTSAVINALTAKPSAGSQSRQIRLRPDAIGSIAAQGSAVTGPEARLAAAQKAYWLANRAKETEQFSYPEFQEPEWADRDWYPIVDKWKERSDKVEVGDDTPRQIPVG